MDRYLKMKKKELEALAGEAGVKGRSRMNKGQLARVLAELSKTADAEDLLPASLPIAVDQGADWTDPNKAPDLPVYLRESRLCLLPQKPRNAFAYWEMESDLPDNTTFRVLSVPDGDEIMELAVRGRLGSSYINLSRAGMEIESELGVRGPEGFVPFARSNRIRLPDDSPSEELHTLWMTRRREHEEIFRLSGGTRGGEIREGVYGVRRPGAPLSSWSQGAGRKRP